MKNKLEYIQNIIEKTLSSDKYQLVDRDMVFDLVKKTLSNENEREKIKQQINEAIEEYANKKNQT